MIPSAFDVSAFSMARGTGSCPGRATSEADEPVLSPAAAKAQQKALKRVFEAIWTQVTGTPGAQVSERCWRVGRVTCSLSPHSNLGDLRQIFAMPKGCLDAPYSDFSALHRRSYGGYNGDVSQLTALAQEFGLDGF